MLGLRIGLIGRGNQFLLRYKKLLELLNAAVLYLLMCFAAILRMRHIAVENVAVAGLKFAGHCTAHSRTAADIVGKNSEQKRVRAKRAEHGTILEKILTEQSIRLLLAESLASPVLLTGKHLVAITYERPMACTVKSLILLDNLYSLIEIRDFGDCDLLFGSRFVHGDFLIAATGD